MKDITGSFIFLINHNFFFFEEEILTVAVTFAQVFE